ncbi:sigma-54-dependent transcriptional regulator [Siphonobacter sp.]|uniref:sigma-54-dependent transcriptional regulator n=1 Tax=Siphonobacter sp. TaxID=1869184 RepID=UPI003B3A365A
MGNPEHILIVEDEFIVANDLRHILEHAGYRVNGIAASVEQARRLIKDNRPNWVLLDIMLTGSLTGIDLGHELLAAGIPFLYISANTNQKTLEAAKVTQPYGFLVKPFREKDLLVMLDIARYKFSLAHPLPTIQPQAAAGGMVGIIGQSGRITKVLEQVRLVAPSDTSVLITGESGTGKELIAKSIHRLSRRSKAPFVTVNCAALPLNLIESELFGYEKGAYTGANQKRIGKFEQAQGGTIFLDEIGELPLEAQVKLLRVLQEKEIERLGSETSIRVDVRILAATNRVLEKEVAEGRFRLDLYYRLSVFPIELPPLRERQEDILLLANYFLNQFSTKLDRQPLTFGPEAMQQLVAYTWPGNIRQLEHLIERHVLMTSERMITRIQLPPDSPVHSHEIKTMEELERDHILHTLKTCQGKVSGRGGAAELLGLPAQTLYTKMKRLGIKLDFY